MSLACPQTGCRTATSALLCTGGTCRAQFGSQSFELTHQQASYKASLQVAKSTGKRESLDEARSIGTADSLTAGDTHDVINDEEVQPQATGAAFLSSTIVQFIMRVASVHHLQLLLLGPLTRLS